MKKKIFIFISCILIMLSGCKNESTVNTTATEETTEKTTFQSLEKESSTIESSVVEETSVSLLDELNDKQGLITAVNGVLIQCAANDNVTEKNIFKIDDSHSSGIFSNTYIYYNAFDGRQIEVYLNKVSGDYPQPWTVVSIKDNNSGHCYFSYGSSSLSTDIYDYNSDSLINESELTPEEALEQANDQYESEINEHLNNLESLHDDAEQLTR